MYHRVISNSITMVMDNIRCLMYSDLSTSAVVQALFMNILKHVYSNISVVLQTYCVCYPVWLCRPHLRNILQKFYQFCTIHEPHTTEIIQLK